MVMRPLRYSARTRSRSCSASANAASTLRRCSSMPATRPWRSRSWRCASANAGPGGADELAAGVPYLALQPVRVQHLRATARRIRAGQDVTGAAVAAAVGVDGVADERAAAPGAADQEAQQVGVAG